MEIITRQDALIRGLKHYFTGEPCCHGHVTKRFVGSMDCCSCHKDRMKVYYKTHKKRIIAHVKKTGRKYRIAYNRANHFKKYKVTLEEATALLQQQNHKCAICGGTSSRSLHLDHNHTTGQIRGFLCSACNFLLGHAKESVEILQQSIRYLDKYNQIQLV
jgi:hypothetical protein